MASVLMRPPLRGIGDAAALGDAEIGALADHLGPDSLGRHAHGVIGPVPDLGIGFGRLPAR